MQADLERISKLAEDVCSQLALSLVDVRFAQQGRHRTLEITIYRQGGFISLDDCEKVSRAIDAELEAAAEPVIQGSFDLEVQSPGIERKLVHEREYALFAGLDVEVKTKQKVNDLGAAFTGKLLGLENGLVKITEAKKISDKASAKKSGKKAQAEASETNATTVEVALNEIISVKLKPQMPTQADEAAMVENDGQLTTTE